MLYIAIMVARITYTIKLLLVGLAIVLCSFMTPLEAQIPGIDLLGKKDHREFKYDLQQGFMVVEVLMEGVIPLKMIFDTGAENTILFDRELADAVGATYEREILITGSDLDTVITANISRKIELKLERCKEVTRDIIIIKNNNFLLREKLGIEVNGILGGSFFPNTIIRVETKKKKIHIYRPSAFDEDLKDYDKIPIEVIANKPYLNCTVATASITPIKVKLLLDTGASLPFLLHTNTDTNLVLPQRTMLGTVGFGLSGPIRGVIGKSDFLRFGDYSYENIITSFQDIYFANNRGTGLIRNGILGNLLLRRFDYYINYTKEELYLKGGKKYNNEFDYDKSGMSVVSFGPSLNQFMIASVIEGSPAAAADIEPGDLVYRINGRSAQGISLESIASLLSQKEGRKIKIVLDRNGKLVKKQFRLQDWYAPTGQFGF